MQILKSILVALLLVSSFSTCGVRAQSLDLTSLNNNPLYQISTSDEIAAQKIDFTEINDENLLGAEGKKMIHWQVKEAGYDFLQKKDGQTILVVYAGEKNTGGYSIEVKKVEVYQEKIRILIKETSPKPGDFVTMAFTYPYTIVEFQSPLANFMVVNTAGDTYQLIN